MEKFIKNTLFDIQGLLKHKTGTEEAEPEEVEYELSHEQVQPKIEVVEEVKIVESKQHAKSVVSSTPPPVDPNSWLGKISKYWSKQAQETPTTSEVMSKQPTTAIHGLFSPQATVSSLIDIQSAFTKEEVESMIQAHTSEWRKPWTSRPMDRSQQ